jgi:hypothetical protein
MQQRSVNVSNVTPVPRRTLQSTSSKISSSNVPLERQPMLDISNKLHALVDEFVSNLSSECDSLTHNVSAQAYMYDEQDSPTEGTQGSRANNRTTIEVLNGLKRPGGSHVADVNHRGGQSPVVHGSPIFQDKNSRSRDCGGVSATTPDQKTGSARLAVSSRSVDSIFDDLLMLNEENFSRPTIAQAGKGKVVKTSKKNLGKQRATKVRNSSPPGRAIRIDIGSPSRSFESSHVMNYSHEEDTPSAGGKSNEVGTTFPKLKWPKSPGGSHEDAGSGSDNSDNDILDTEEPHMQNETAEGDDDINQQEGDELDDEDLGPNAVSASSDAEELQVLPKVPVKRKLLSEPKSSDRKSQRGRSTSKSPQVKKYKTPTIDASVITKLTFGKRPLNSVSITDFKFLHSRPP